VPADFLARGANLTSCHVYGISAWNVRLDGAVQSNLVITPSDEAMLSIRFDKKVIALPGDGSPWAVSFRVEARTLWHLPKRLMRENIGVSIWESRITLGNCTYAGTLEGFGTTDPSRVQ
jgi:hypothetical protein